METIKAMANGFATRHKELMVFDWIKAATIIKERKPKIAKAGLQSDWEWTGGVIWENDKPLPKEETYCFLASTWAIPELNVDGEIIECYKMQSEVPNWGSGTYWPEEALQALQTLN